MFTKYRGSNQSPPILRCIPRGCFAVGLIRSDDADLLRAARTQAAAPRPPRPELRPSPASQPRDVSSALHAVVTATCPGSSWGTSVHLSVCLSSLGRLPASGMSHLQKHESSANKPRWSLLARDWVPLLQKTPCLPFQRTTVSGHRTPRGGRDSTVVNQTKGKEEGITSLHTEARTQRAVPGTGRQSGCGRHSPRAGPSAALRGDTQAEAC